MKRHSKSSPISKECPTPDLQLFKDSKNHKFVQLVFFIATLAAMLCTHMYTRAEVPRSDLCQRQCKTNARFLMNRRNRAQVKVGRSADSASYINHHKSFIPEAMSSAAHPRCGCASGAPTGSKWQYDSVWSTYISVSRIKKRQYPRNAKNIQEALWLKVLFLALVKILQWTHGSSG